MPEKDRIKKSIGYLAVTLVTFLALQALLIVMHEFTHSTTAWALGCMSNPLDIVWGDPVMMTGWDEGVAYKKLFARGLMHQGAMIGASPLVMHFCMAGLCLYLMLRKNAALPNWLLHCLFWFCAANFMELAAYIPMRGFSAHGDTGNFNRGMGLSPWYLFVLGSAALGLLLYLYFRKALPRLWSAFAKENPALQWASLTLSAFIVFFWGSGIRVMAHVYPDPQWLFGLLGFPAFFLCLYWFRPSRNHP